MGGRPGAAYGRRSGPGGGRGGRGPGGSRGEARAGGSPSVRSRRPRTGGVAGATSGASTTIGASTHDRVPRRAARTGVDAGRGGRRAAVRRRAVAALAVGGRRAVAARAVGGRRAVAALAVGGRRAVAALAVGGRRAVAARAVGGRRAVAAGAVGGRRAVAAGAVGGRRAVAARAVGGRPMRGVRPVRAAAGCATTVAARPGSGAAVLPRTRRALVRALVAEPEAASLRRDLAAAARGRRAGAHPGPGPPGRAPPR